MKAMPISNYKPSKVGAGGGGGAAKPALMKEKPMAVRKPT